LVVVFDLDLGLGRNVEIGNIFRLEWREMSIIKEHVSAVTKHHGGLLGLCQEVGLAITCGNPEFFHEKNIETNAASKKKIKLLVPKSHQIKDWIMDNLLSSLV